MFNFSKWFRHYEAFIDANEAVRLDSKAFKAMYRIGKALSELGYYSKAREWLIKTLEYCNDMKVSLDLANIQDMVGYFLDF